MTGQNFILILKSQLLHLHRQKYQQVLSRDRLSDLQKQISMHRRTAQNLQDSSQAHITYMMANLCTSDVTALPQSQSTVARVRLISQGMLLILILSNIDILSKREDLDF